MSSLPHPLRTKAVPLLRHVCIIGMYMYVCYCVCLFLIVSLSIGASGSYEAEKEGHFNHLSRNAEKG